MCKSQHGSCFGHIGQHGTHARDYFYLCQVAQDGQGKYIADFCVSKSQALLLKIFATVNTPLTINRLQFQFETYQIKVLPDSMVK